jgi:hypothetical protein
MTRYARRLTDDALLLCSAFTDEIADNYQPRGYADSHLSRGIMPSTKSRDSLNRLKASAYCTLRTIPMCLWVSRSTPAPEGPV